MERSIQERATRRCLILLELKIMHIPLDVTPYTHKNLAHTSLPRAIERYSIFLCFVASFFTAKIFTSLLPSTIQRALHDETTMKWFMFIERRRLRYLSIEAYYCLRMFCPFRDHPRASQWRWFLLFTFFHLAMEIIAGLLLLLRFISDEI